MDPSEPRAAREGSGEMSPGERSRPAEDPPAGGPPAAATPAHEAAAERRHPWLHRLARHSGRP
jgi:hypothetical protein